MDEFSYLSVLISVILGLAVTQILKGFRGILLSRTRVRIYWPVIAWAVLLLLICVQSWWAMFELRHYQPWTFAAFAVVLLQTIVTSCWPDWFFPICSVKELSIYVKVSTRIVSGSSRSASSLFW